MYSYFLSHTKHLFKIFSVCRWFGWVCRITHRFTRCGQPLNDFHLCTADIITAIKIGRGPDKVHWRSTSSGHWCVCAATNLYVNFRPTAEAANCPKRSCKYPKMSQKNSPSIRIRTWRHAKCLTNGLKGLRQKVRVPSRSGKSLTTY